MTAQKLNCERITKKRQYGYIVDDGDEAIAIQKLGELEDELEQGLWIELPCKVGDIVYSVTPKCKWFGKCSEFDQHCCSRRSCDAFITEEKFTLYLFNRIGEDIFLTKEEAEAKIAEWKGNKE